MSKLSAGLKKVRKTLHLPPVTLKNVATKYAPVAAGVGALAGVGPLAGLASKIPGAAKVGSIYNTIRGRGGSTNIGGVNVPTGGFDYSGIADKVSGDSGSFLDRATGLVKGVRQATGGKPITLRNTLGGIAGKIGSTIRDNPLETAGALASGYSAAQAYKRAGDYEGKAIKTKEQSYNERAPLRARGVSGMLKDTAQPLQDFVNTQNPFARKRKVGF